MKNKTKTLYKNIFHKKVTNEKGVSQLHSILMNNTDKFKQRHTRSVFRAQFDSTTESF